VPRPGGRQSRLNRTELDDIAQHLDAIVQYREIRAAPPPICNIRVIDFNGGGSIGYVRAGTRYLMSYVSGYVSGFALLLGYLWMLWDGEKQTWHDKVSNSVVVPVSSYPVERWPG
jgi:hypothetical protein